PEPLRSKNARAVVAERGGSARADERRGEQGGGANADVSRAEESGSARAQGGSARAHESRAEVNAFPPVSDLTAQRIRRAAEIHSPGLRCTRLDVVEDE